jgi:hypothetical protein
MAKNHRRKYPKHANEKYLSPGGWHWSGSYRTSDNRQAFWRATRRKTRQSILKEDWDSLPHKYPPTILWNIH